MQSGTEYVVNGRELVKNKTVRLYRMSTPEHECPWGLRAIDLLNEREIEFEDHRLTSQQEIDDFKARYQVAATPQIFLMMSGLVAILTWQITLGLRQRRPIILTHLLLLRFRQQP